MPTDLTAPPRPTPTAPPRTGPARDVGVGARVVSLVLGAWLFLSAFLLPHTAGSRTNDAIVGTLSVAAALWAMREPMARFLNTTLSLWLFFATLSLYPIDGGTLTNNLAVAVLMFVASLIPGRGTRRGLRPPRYAEA